MNLKITEELFERHQEIYSKMKTDLRLFLASTLTEGEKEDLNAAHMTIMIVLRVAANMAISMGIDSQAFLFAAKQMFRAECISQEETNEKTDEKLN